MNQVLGYILKLIYNNIDEETAPWMIRIASKLNLKKQIKNVINMNLIKRLFTINYFKFNSRLVKTTLFTSCRENL